MMLAIVNVSKEHAPIIGMNEYEVRINTCVIATFEHDRKPNGAAQCLRDAADAVERCQEEKKLVLMTALVNEVHNAKLSRAAQAQNENAGVNSVALK
jgi:hypothetical protein